MIHDVKDPWRTRLLRSLNSGTPRTRFIICLAISALAHAGILAWGTIGVSEGPTLAVITTRSPALTVNENPPEQFIQVIQIQPPALVPSTRSSAGRVGNAMKETSPVVPALATAPMLPATGLELAFIEAAPVALPSVREAVVDDLETSRPNRGIVLRAGDDEGSSTSFNGQGSTGRLGTGRGGTGGPFIGRGRGGGCIRIGLVRPAGLISDLRGRGGSFPTGRIGRFGGNRGSRR